MSFYIVVNGTRGPSSYPHQHKTYRDAAQEAARLAGHHPNDTFFVLQTIKAFRKRDVDVLDACPQDAAYIQDDEIPF